MINTRRFLTLTVLVSLFLVILVPFIKTDFFLFPFITGKNFLFRLAVEVGFAAWLVLIIRHPEYRPHRSPLLWAVGAFVLATTLSTIFGVNPYRSFWSNYERMEGLVTFLHLGAFFLMAGSMFRTKTNELLFFRTSLGLSVLISFYALLQWFGVLKTFQSATRVEATLGNSAYLAIYLLFNIGIAAWLWMQGTEKDKDERLFFRVVLGTSIIIPLFGLLQGFKAAFLSSSTIWQVSPGYPIYLLLHIGVVVWLWTLVKKQKPRYYFYGAIIAFFTFILFLTETRGTLLGLIAALLVGAVMTALLRKGKPRQYALGVLGVVVLLVALFIPLRNTALVQKNGALQRLASISLSDTTTQSRFTIWKMGYEGFKERPIFGWGPENYLVVFNKYYEPSLWPQEPWFDRAHNVFFDWLVMGGIVGLLAYLSLFGASLYLLFGHHRKLFSVSERIVIVALFAGYMVHNFFVFDNVTSYILFFSILAFLYARAGAERTAPHREIGEGAQSLLIPAVILVLCASAYFFVYKGAVASNTLIQALSSQNADDGLAKFKKVFTLNTFGSNEALEQLLIGAVGVIQNQNIPAETKQKFDMLAKEAAATELARSNRVDSRQLLMYGSYLGRTGGFAEAEKILAEARTHSPKKQQIIFEQINLAVNENKLTEALTLAKEAFLLDQTYPEARRIYGIILILSGKGSEAEALFSGEHSSIADSRIAQAYIRVGQNKSAINILEKITSTGTNDAQVYLVLASAYLTSGDRAKSITALEKAGTLNANLKEQTDYLIGEIKAGRNPQ